MSNGASIGMRKLWKRFFRRLIQSFNFELPRSFHGKTIRIPVLAGIKVGIHTEEWMLGVLELLFRQRPGAFIDIGANLGQTLLKVKHLDPEREYVGFEPNPICINYLRRLIQCNRYRATLVPVGVGNLNDVLRLVMYGNNAADPAASMVPAFRADRSTTGEIMVPVFRFEKLLNFIPERVAIVKIDVEGAELEVLQGMGDFLQSRSPLILFEVLPVYTAENHMRLDRQTKVEALLRRLNYVVFRVRKDAYGAYAGLGQITSLGIHGDLNQCDYVGVPAAQVAEFA